MSDILIGWLAPNGIFHKCGFMEHMDKAEELVKYYYNEDVYLLPDEFLYQKGFVKFTRNEVFLLCNEGYKTFSDKQASFLNDFELTSGQKISANYIFEYVERFGATCGDENLKPFEIPRVIHAMEEYP